MKSLFLLIFLAFFPAVIFSQDIELGGSELNGNDILDWNTPHILIPAPSASMVPVDSIVVQSSLENEAFYTEVVRILKGAGFEPESGIEYRKSALKAHQMMHTAEYEIIVINFRKIFRSSTLPNNARVIIYASAAKSELNPADIKSLDKLKDGLTKQLKNAPKQGKAPSAPTFTADERRIVNQFSRRSIPAVNLINGTNTLQQIADQARLQKEEVAQIFTFMLENGFANITKHGS
jgi:hypothetical protein